MPLKSTAAAVAFPLELGGETWLASRLARTQKTVWRSLRTRWCLGWHRSHHEMLAVDCLRVKVHCQLCGRMVVRTRKSRS
jgi:hypothetical protein